MPSLARLGLIYSNRFISVAFGAGGVAGRVGLAVDLAADIFEDLVWHLQKDLNDLGIKLAAGPGLDLLASFAEGSGGTIRAVGDDGIEGIGDGEDACAERNFVALETAGIAAAIEVFLVGINDVASFDEERNFPEHLVAVIAVLAHDLFFFLVQLSGFEQNAIRNGDLANVVKKRATSDHVDLLFRQPHLFRDCNREGGDAP